ncbi:MAG: multidrug effflux MFS transporter [Marinomonas sp.]
MSYSSSHTHTNTQSMPFWGFVCLMAMIFSLSPLAIDMYLPALPQMAHFFDTRIDAMEASVAIYLLSFALGQLVFGTLADKLNKTSLLSWGLIGFATASFIVAFSTNLTWLFIGRGVQGFLGGTSVVVFTLIQQSYGKEKSSQIISYIMAVVVIAPMVAPMLGSQILLYLGWQWIFFCLGFFAFITFFTQLFINSQTSTNKEAETHTSSTKKSGNKSRNKVKLSEIFKGYRFVLTNPLTLSYMFAGSASFAGLFAFISGSPFVYMSLHQVSPQDYSLLIGLNAVAMISTNLLNARRLGHIDPNIKLIWAGIGLGVIGFYLFLVASLALSLPYIVLGVVLYMAMLGFTSANAIAGVLSSSGQYAGLASGLNGVMQFGLGALASAVISLSESINSMPMAFSMTVSSLLTCAFAFALIKQTKKEA